MWQCISEDKLEEVRLETRRLIKEVIVIGKQEGTVLMNTVAVMLGGKLKRDFWRLIDGIYSTCDSPPLSLSPYVHLLLNPTQPQGSAQISCPQIKPQEKTNKHVFL